MKKKKSLFIFHVFFALLFLAYLLWPTDEGRIRKLFKEGAEAIQREDLDAVMSNVSYSYLDDYGLTYFHIKESMRSFFKQMADIKITYEKSMIKVNGKDATADLDMKITATAGSNTRYVLGDSKRPIHLRFILKKERMKWLVAKIEGLPSK